MINLSKITAICKQFAKEFGDTVEGQGYSTILKMLEMSGFVNPSTAKEIFKKFDEMVKSYGIQNKYPSISIDIDPLEVKIKAYISNVKGNIEGKTIKDFFEKLESVLKEQSKDVVKIQSKTNEDIQIN